MFFVLFAFALCSVPIYKDPTASIDERIDDLMDKMTDDERIGQLVQVDGHFDIIIPFMTQHIGSVISSFGLQAKLAVTLSRNSRLGIPILLGMDAIHGNAFYKGAVVFPTQLGAAQSWDIEMMEQMGNVTASELRYTGPSWTFSPVCCIARDPRWGRVDETFGEDPFLIGKFASAMIRGLQGPNGVTNNPEKVMATVKHFAGYSETIGGRDSTESEISQRKLKSYFLPPFEETIKEKPGSFMSGYQAIDGVPCTSNKWLLHDVLVEEWGFDGFVVTDYNNVEYMVSNQHVFKSYDDASASMVNNGNDMSMVTSNFFSGAKEAVKSGKLSMAAVNQSCRKILRKKFELGLFEDDRYPDDAKAAEHVGTPHNRNQALKIAEEALLLMKNDGLLPLKESDYKKIAIVGPNSDNVLQMNGDWSLGTGQINMFENHPRELTITILDGIKARFSGEVNYELGAGIEPAEKGDLKKAINLVNEADLSIVVIGDRLTYYSEQRSTATLELMGEQIAFLDAIIATKKKFILSVVSSKPLVIPQKYIDAASAVIWQFTPGMLGGKAFAEAVFGDINPSGRLTISIPRHVGQLPVFYNQVRGEHGNAYADIGKKPMYSFGYGLSYTTFEYKSASLDKQKYSTNENIKVTVKVANTGKYDGVEVVQAYLHDKFTSATWAEMELKGFERVFLKAGEEKDVTIVIPAADCSIVNAEGKRVVEPGDFEIRVGMAADDIKHTLDFAIQ